MDRQTVKSANKFYENTANKMSRSTKNTINKWLISDLAGLVLKYCWPDTDDFEKSLHYGIYENFAEPNVYIADFEKIIYHDSVHIINNACRNGYLKIMKLLVDGGMKDVAFGGLYGACQDGNVEMVKLMLNENGSVYNEWVNWLYDYYWTKSLEWACLLGYMEIVKLIVGYYHKMKGVYPLSLDTFTAINSIGLESACYGGHIDIAKFFIENEEFEKFDLNSAFANACAGGQVEIAKLLIHQTKKYNYKECISAHNNGRPCLYKKLFPE